MPEHGLTFAKRDQLLSYEELLSLIDTLGDLGISKIRITGGEPFVRADLMCFLRKLRKREFLETIRITSNLTLIRPYLDELLALGIRDINVSLDALNKEKFFMITRRDKYEEVYQVLMLMIEKGFQIKINCVVMKKLNEDQVLPLLNLAKEYPIAVRFLEEMPFNGSGKARSKTINYKEILSLISENFDYSTLINEPSSTSQKYKIDGFVGSFGIIPSFSRTFCGDCNRLRLAATGEVRTCLYGGDQLSLRDLLRSGVSEEKIKEALVQTIRNKSKDGFTSASENEEKYLSMTKLGG